MACCKKSPTQGYRKRRKHEAEIILGSGRPEPVPWGASLCLVTGQPVTPLSVPPRFLHAQDLPGCTGPPGITLSAGPHCEQLLDLTRGENSWGPHRGVRLTVRSRLGGRLL